MHEGVGEGEAGGVHDLVAVEEDVEVDRARGPLEGAGSAELGFGGEEAVEEGVGVEGGLDFGNGVEEVGGVGGAADGGVFEEGGEAGDRQVGGGQEGEGGAEVGGAVAEVGAEGDVGGGGGHWKVFAALNVLRKGWRVKREDVKRRT